MKPQTKRILSCIGLILYFSCYLLVRAKGDLIHRHTWNNGWSRHWIVPASTDGEARLAFIAMVLSEDPSSVEVQEEAMESVQRIEWGRRVLQCIFIPLVAGESAVHWAITPRVKM